MRKVLGCRVTTVPSSCLSCSKRKKKVQRRKGRPYVRYRLWRPAHAGSAGEEVVACKGAVEEHGHKNAKGIAEGCDVITRESGLLHAQDRDTFEQGGNVDLCGLRQRRVLAGLVQVAQTQKSETLELARSITDE